MVALVLADALLEKFGGDSIAELTRAIDAAAAATRDRFRGVAAAAINNQ